VVTDSFQILFTTEARRKSKGLPVSQEASDYHNCNLKFQIPDSRFQVEISNLKFQILKISNMRHQALDLGFQIGNLRDHVKSLLIIAMQQSALVQILATETMSGPRHGLEPLLQDRLTTVNTLSILPVLDAIQRRVD